MARFCFLISVLFLGANGAFAQSASSDSQTLQALLAEVRQLRQDLQTTTVAAQRAHILLYRLQAEESAVTRATQRLDDARLKLSETQSNRRNMAAQIKHFEELQSHAENSSAERRNAEAALPQFKARFEALGDEEQQRQIRQIEAEEQVRLAQAKLNELQGQLERLENLLRDPRSPQPANSPR